MRIPRIFLAALMLAVVGAAVLGCGGTTGVSEADYQALQTKLDTAQQSLADAQDQVSQLQQDLLAARAEAGTLKTQLADAAAGQIDPADYSALQQQYQSSQAQVDSLTAQLANASKSYDAAQAEIDDYVTQIADLQQQIDELSAPATTEPPVPLTEGSIQTVLWDRVNQERAAAGVSQLTTGQHLVQWSAQHVQQMDTAHHTTTFTDATIPVQAAYMAVGYQEVYELVDAVIYTWKISPQWYSDQILQPNVSYGGLSVLESGEVFYISFMASNYP